MINACLTKRNIEDLDFILENTYLHVKEEFVIKLIITHFFTKLKQFFMNKNSKHINI